MVSFYRTTRENSPLLVCGIDEAGRGPLAGPVCAAAVILGSDFPIYILNDSKKISAAKREEARKVIYQKAAAWGIGWASHTEIDSINILQASLLAMRRAYEEMSKKFKDISYPLGEDLQAIVDGTHTPKIAIPCKAMVKADAEVPEVMAASILAKTERDIYMNEMAKLYPQYGYDKHKGYPTQAHREIILKLGPSPIQRLTFKVK